jgi:hypothetical protein
MRTNLLRREPLVSSLVHVERYSMMWKTHFPFVLLSVGSSAAYSFILPSITIHSSVFVDVYVCVCLPAYLSVCLSISLQHEGAMTQ